MLVLVTTRSRKQIDRILADLGWDHWENFSWSKLDTKGEGPDDVMQPGRGLGNV